MILKIKEVLGLKPLMKEYLKEVVEREKVNDNEIMTDDKFTGMPGQLFHNCLMVILYCCQHE